jgi:hypothetical protein
VHYDVTERDLAGGMALQAALADCLRRDALAGWIGGEAR